MMSPAVVLVSVLTTLYELEEEQKSKDAKMVFTTGIQMHCSELYLALGMDIHEFERHAAMLRGLGVCTVTAETIELTPLGREKARHMCEVLKKGSAGT